MLETAINDRIKEHEVRNSEAVILEMSERTRGKKASGCGADICNKYRLSGFMRIVRKAEFYNLLLNN